MNQANDQAEEAAVKEYDKKIVQGWYTFKLSSVTIIEFELWRLVLDLRLSLR